jgi:hypothetical protein
VDGGSYIAFSSESKLAQESFTNTKDDCRWDNYTLVKIYENTYFRSKLNNQKYYFTKIPVNP